MTVEEADDCARLNVETLLEGAELDAALRAEGLGSLAADGADLEVDALHARAAAQAGAPDWESRWAAMLEYARGRGWVSADGRTVRAHVEPVRADSEPGR